MLIATKDGQVIEVGYRYSRDPENDAKHEMNSRKTKVEMENSHNQEKRVARKMKLKTFT